MSIFTWLRVSNNGYSYYKKAKQGNITAHSFFSDLKMFVMMIREYFSGSYSGIRKRTFVKIVFGLLYLVFFIDLIPDFIPFIGWLDDAAVLFFIWRSMRAESNLFRHWKMRQSTAEKI